MQEEVWYEIQYSKAGADDWYTTATTRDTLEAAKEALARSRRNSPAGYEYRIAKRTLREEILEDSLTEEIVKEDAK